MTNLPSGKELDAAVLRAMGFEFVDIPDFAPPHWRKTSERGCESSREPISTSDAEALRLCGPWLDEHTWRWTMESDATGVGMSFKERIGDFGIALQRRTTFAEAICRLVLAVAAREAEQRK